MKLTGFLKAAYRTFLLGGLGFGLSACPAGDVPCEQRADCALGLVCQEGFCQEPAVQKIDPYLLDVGGGTFYAGGGWSLEVLAGAYEGSTSLELKVLSASTDLQGLSALSSILQVNPQISLSGESRVVLDFSSDCIDCSLWQSDAVDAEFMELNTEFSDGHYAASTSTLAFFVLAKSSKVEVSDAGVLDGGEIREEAGVENVDAGIQDAGNRMDSGSIVDSGWEEVELFDSGVDSGFIDAGRALDGGSIGFVCSDAACFPRVCEVDLQVCVECISDEQCGSEGECNLEENRCVQQECVLDEDCPEQNVCFLNECVLQPCADNVECGANKQCNVSTGQCESIAPCINNLGCSASEVCDVSVGQCVDNTQECSVDEDCGTGFFCENSMCYKIGECASDSECAVNARCDLESFSCVVFTECIDDTACDVNAFCSESGQCTTLLCSSDSECPQSLSCDLLLGGFCLQFPTCENDVDCAVNQMCDVGFGVCIDA